MPLATGSLTFTKTIGICVSPWRATVTDQLLRERAYPIDVTSTPPKVHPHVAAIGPTQVRERLRKRRNATLPLSIVFVVGQEHADAPHAVARLRARRQRPCRRAAEPSDEFAP
jgi:hypothetical protein